jgi:glucokinase
MSRTIGLLVTRDIRVSAVENNRLAGPGLTYAGEPGDDELDMKTLPGEEIIARAADMVVQAAAGHDVLAVGAGVPGIVRNGVVEDSPNLPQAKGMRVRDDLQAALRARGLDAPVCAMNDADALAAGIAASLGQLERVVRVWFLGDGIGFGRYPHDERAWEAGHSVVTLDPKERYCGCGGIGHLEGIMGHRAMRLRFLDLEPEEVFEAAAAGDSRCSDFVRIWHRALAAATATGVHLEGPGKFFLAGPNAHFVDTAYLSQVLQDMVKMTPLQGSTFEVVAAGTDVALIGAAVTAGIGR